MDASSESAVTILKVAIDTQSQHGIILKAVSPQMVLAENIVNDSGHVEGRRAAARTTKG